jgi:hypothetical protein
VHRQGSLRLVSSARNGRSRIMRQCMDVAATQSLNPALSAAQTCGPTPDAPPIRRCAAAV